MLDWAVMRSQFKAIAWLCVRTPNKTRYAWRLASSGWQWMDKMFGHGLRVLAAQVALVNGGLVLTLWKNNQNQKEPSVRGCCLNRCTKLMQVYASKHTCNHVSTNKRPVNPYRPLVMVRRLTRCFTTIVFHAISHPTALGGWGGTSGCGLCCESRVLWGLR